MTVEVGEISTRSQIMELSCFQVTCQIFVSLLYTLSVIVILYFDGWDYSHYYSDSGHVALLNERYNISNTSVDAYSSSLSPGDTVFLNYHRSKCNNFTMPFTDEASGVWRICRQTTEEERKDITSQCGKIDQCFWYFSDLLQHTSFCCKFCCPYPAAVAEDLLISGDTTYVAVYTLVSAMIVSLLLHAASYVQMVISFTTNHVVVTRMTGITFLLSGLFLGFALIVNHYKISIMNQGRSLPMFPLDVGLIRSTRVGWCMLLGWLCVPISCVVGTFWIILSYHLVAGLSRGFYNSASESAYKKNNGGKPTNNKIPPQKLVPVANYNNSHNNNNNNNNNNNIVNNTMNTPAGNDTSKQTRTVKFDIK